LLKIRNFVCIGDMRQAMGTFPRRSGHAVKLSASIAENFRSENLSIITHRQQRCIGCDA